MGYASNKLYIRKCLLYSIVVYYIDHLSRYAKYKIKLMGQIKDLISCAFFINNQSAVEPLLKFKRLAYMLT